MKTSIIIPCHPSHFPYLNALICSYENQTVLPDEVIISLSEANKVCKDQLESLRKASRPFDLIIKATNKKKSVGQNRNIANDAASGDILINQDADDSAHPQRVEIIRYFFKKFNLDVLFHRHKYQKIASLHLDPKQIDYFFPKHHLQRTSHFNPSFVSLSSKVAKKIKWPDMLRRADMVFSIQLFQQFQHILAIDAFLIEYRVDQSTYSKEEKEKNFSPSQLAQIEKEKEIVNKIIQENVSADFTTGLRWLSYFCRDNDPK